MRTESRIVIHRPVNEVFSFISDPHNLPKWFAGFKEFQPISGEPGRLGSRNRQTLEEMGYTVEVEEEVIGYQENQLLSSKVSHPEAESVITFRFDNKGNDTEVVFDTDTQIKSWKYKMMAPLISGQVQRRQDESLQKLKNMIESGVA